MSGDNIDAALAETDAKLWREELGPDRVKRLRQLIDEGFDKLRSCKEQFDAATKATDAILREAEQARSLQDLRWKHLQEARKELATNLNELKGLVEPGAGA